MTTTDSSVAGIGPPVPRREPIRILLLAANPLGTERLAIEEEARAISQRLRLSRDRDTFELITCLAVRPADLLQYLNQYRPHVVHFSGHGVRTGEIVLSADDGNANGQVVGVAALAELFRIMCDDLRVVLLNACHTSEQARAIGRHVDFVIGTRAEVTDEAATVFAAAFYSALGFGRAVPEAFDQARAALMVHGIPGHDIPALLARPGADPHLQEGASMSSNTNPPGQSGQNLGGVNVSVNGGSGNIVNGTGTINLGTPVKKGMSFDTKMLLGTLVFDVVFFFYGMWSYTGKNTSAETWRAVIFIVMLGVTGGMVRRWLRRRT